MTEHPLPVDERLTFQLSEDHWVISSLMRPAVSMPRYRSPSNTAATFALVLTMALSASFRVADVVSRLRKGLRSCSGTRPKLSTSVRYNQPSSLSAAPTPTSRPRNEQPWSSHLAAMPRGLPPALDRDRQHGSGSRRAASNRDRSPGTRFE